jgi:hypothetical protein
MAVVLQPYSPSVFNNLPSLNEVNTKAKEVDAASVIASEIANLFVKYEVQASFGVQLLHHHFNLHNDEQLVDVGGAAIPWCLGHAEDLNSRVYPTSWVFKGDTYHPYEFQFSPPSQTLPAIDIDSTFLVAFNDVLKKYNLQGILGLRALKDKAERKPEMEITQGRANVTFDYLPDGTEKAVEATWAFEGDGSPTVRSYCVSFCSTRSGGHHGSVHQTNRYVLLPLRLISCPTCSYICTAAKYPHVVLIALRFGSDCCSVSLIYFYGTCSLVWTSIFPFSFVQLLFYVAAFFTREEVVDSMHHIFFQRRKYRLRVTRLRWMIGVKLWRAAC